jgi:hypothetical protein
MGDYRMFNQQELQLLLGGVNTPIDLEDLRRNTNYGGLYDDKEPTIIAFWRVRPQTERSTSPFVGFLLYAHFILHRSWRVSTLNNAGRYYVS